MATKIIVKGSRRARDGNGFERFSDTYTDTLDVIYDYCIDGRVVRVFTVGDRETSNDAIVRDYAPGVWEIVEIVEK